MDCLIIDNPSMLVSTFKNSKTEELNKVFKCFYILYFEKFQMFAKKNYFIPEEEFIHDAFVDGLVSFYFYLTVNGFNEKLGSIQTFFFEFCKRKLLGYFKVTKKHKDKNSYQDPNILEGDNSNPSDESHIELKEFEIQKQNEQKMFEAGWVKLGERCKNLLLWRKIERLSNHIIASRLNIEETSVNNEVFKCFKKLKGNIDNLNAE